MTEGKTPSWTRRLRWRLEALAMDAAASTLRLLPLEWASAAGGALLRLIGPLTREHRVADANLRIAFPDKDAAWRRRVVMEHWDNLGRTGAEFAMIDRILADGNRIELVGGERFEALAREKRPAMLVSGHLANWEIIPLSLILTGISPWISYRPANNPHTDRRIVSARESLGLRFAPKGTEGSRVLIAAMDRGESVALLNDQRDNDGVEAPLFGVPARTAGGPTRLALRPGVEMIPVKIARLPGVRFRIVIDEPIRLQRTGDRKADLAAGVAQVNRFIEEAVRENPGQWLWSHRRWPKEAYAGMGLKL